MKKRSQRKSIEVFSLSFLDVVSCGFGAIILLLVISKISQPLVIEETTTDLRKVLAALEQQLEIIQGEIKTTDRALTRSTKENSTLKSQKKNQASALSQLKNEFKDANNSLNAQSIIKEKLAQAKQSLTDEMRRLQQTTAVVNKENTVGGISVNSEYIIFIIDTSGSMRNFAWPLVRKKMQEILKIYPNVKGIQVMNDMGDYMFSQYAGRWIKDTPGRRRAILKRLVSWEPFSNSSPEEGISQAIRRFYSSDKAISLYIFGDDFARGSIQAVVETVARLNKTNRASKKRVRINAVGFPVLFNHPGTEVNIARFAALMRKLAENNEGSFVGLTSLR
ncbi:VWA domain-containing protein [sulfur-oxidizing endosymbiont of Gigantopelta aegis]|uniref:VWA domain-containing protein n=1 Tax=sulfur-oxidizing endosymbiont of Gigantopelta aegis TaxID=2794934 RepID=UPI0018DB4222|nr:VWA domain-containing protein [sulfur-oxidizing endosymbiont of Gigantopelta aegis]